ncbi:hypothetical protein BKA00_007463 [Actinomadura coerulea]|uniref:Uncharacterized protein n=1 Tax=Actinomadura coerulea TaxID=46159 RepID=A0A7X0L3R8_9ACTN|nr:hypothetical protein [Actinomadura coerulea]MBB6400549.1 hypothetical protein [Actinomadura coerulea]
MEVILRGRRGSWSVLVDDDEAGDPVPLYKGFPDRRTAAGAHRDFVGVLTAKGWKRER